jgi:hypothetical protein
MSDKTGIDYLDATCEAKGGKPLITVVAEDLATNEYILNTGERVSKVEVRNAGGLPAPGWIDRQMKRVCEDYAAMPRWMQTAKLEGAGMHKKTTEELAAGLGRMAKSEHSVCGRAAARLREMEPARAALNELFDVLRCQSTPQAAVTSARELVARMEQAERDLAALVEKLCKLFGWATYLEAYMHIDNAVNNLRADVATERTLRERAKAKVRELDVAVAAASLFVRKIYDALGLPEPTPYAVVDLFELHLQVMGQIERFKVEAEQAERDLSEAEAQIEGLTAERDHYRFGVNQQGERIKALEAAGYAVAMLALQRATYEGDAEFRDQVDDLLALTQRAAREPGGEQ